MRMKDDYMRNSQLKPGYNLQIATENQYVLAYDLFPNPTDIKNLQTFLDSFLEQHNELPEYIVADTGYGSEENYTYINDVLHKTPLITYASYRKENKKTYRNSPFMVDNWRDLEEDTYIFPTHRAVPFKRKADLYVTSKFMNVKIVEIVLFVVNVRKQKVSKTDKF